MGRRYGPSPAAKVRRTACPSPDAPRPGCGAPEGQPCVDTDGNPRDANHQARVKAHKRAHPAVETIQAAGGAARDRYGREFGSVAHDTALRFGGMCGQPGCDEPLLSLESSVKTSRGWIHRSCAPGADDA